MNPHKGKYSIAAVMVLWAWTACWSAEFNYASYIETTLQDIITEERNHSIDPAGQKKSVERIEIECRTSKYRVSCNYTAIRRPISKVKKNLIKLWIETLQIDPSLASLYRQEIKVTEGMNVHWIPIQEKLLPHIDRNLGRNDAIELFVLFLGIIDSGYIFIATEFNAIDSNQRKPDLTNAAMREEQYRFERSIRDSAFNRRKKVEKVAIELLIKTTIHPFQKEKTL